MALESTAAFSLDDFRSKVLGTGLARTNRFEVLIPPPKALNVPGTNARTVNLLVEQASMPMLNIFSKAFKIFGPTYQRPITSEYGGEGLSMTFHVDREMYVRKFFEDWMHAVIDPVTFTVGYQEEYITDIYIRQLDEQSNVTHEVILKEAFPRNLNLMDLNHSSSNQTHRLNVLFAYRYWVSTEQERIQPSALSRPVLNPGVTYNDDVSYYEPSTPEEINAPSPYEDGYST